MPKEIKPYTPKKPFTREQKKQLFVMVQTFHLRASAQDKAKKKGK